MSAMSYKLRIALCQTKVTADKVLNIDTARAALESAVSNSAQLLVLPEIWNSPYGTSSFPVYAEPVPEVGSSPDRSRSPSVAMVCDVAKEKNVWIVGGSVPERDIISGVENLYNTCVVVNPEGTIVAKHRKIHLFDIDVPGKIKFKESDSLTAGNTVTTFDAPWGLTGVGICYDIRFPELALIMRQRGCRLLIYPGAFNMVTGPAHWELLQRARAVDNQVFLAACSPARDETSGGYIAWGGSSVVDPWGEVLAKAGAYEETIFADLDLEKVDSTRDSIPCWKQKRNDLYSVDDKTSNKL